MARKVTVPIDISSEQKVILGVLSKRQLMYLIIGGLVIYYYVPKVYGLFTDPLTGIIFAVFSAVPTVIIISVLGFMKHQKHSLNFDKYFFLKLKYSKQLGVWRKGPVITTYDQIKKRKRGKG